MGQGQAVQMSVPAPEEMYHHFASRLKYQGEERGGEGRGKGRGREGRGGGTGEEGRGGGRHVERDC